MQLTGLANEHMEWLLERGWVTDQFTIRNFKSFANQARANVQPRVVFFFGNNGESVDGNGNDLQSGL